MTVDLPLVSSFADILLSFAPAFSQPSFANFATLIAGWVFCMGRRTVTGLITAAGAIGKKHFSCYHRFFSRAVWDLDSLGHIILKLAVRFIPKDAVVRLPSRVDHLQGELVLRPEDLPDLLHRHRG